jgi:glycosyltransferase A (GT-A) superfamily protein (DUF2064 family)
MSAILAAPAPVLLLLAKAPMPGRVKTRLTPQLTPEQAATVAEAALTDTMVTLEQIPASRRVLVLDGLPGRWLRPGWEVVAQSGGGLDARLAAAFSAVDGPAPALLVGMDTPQLAARTLAEPLAPARRADVDAWFGPATDGGFWAFGLARPEARLAARLLRGVPMSVPTTGAALRARLAAEGLRVEGLPELTDVDTPATADEVAALAPGSRFAEAWRSFQSPRPAQPTQPHRHSPSPQAAQSPWPAHGSRTSSRTPSRTPETTPPPSRTGGAVVT